MKEMKIERKEKWIRINTIEGYEEIRDCYYLSNSDEDKIMNRSTGKIMKIKLNKDSYKRVNLMTIDGKQKHYKIHILKVKAFIFGPYPLGANVVRHLDDCKTNNALTNLAWGTQSDNMKDCIRNGNFSYLNVAKNGKRSSKPVRCLETGIIYPSCIEAERQTGISHISACCRGVRHTAGGYHFKFINKEVNSNDMEYEQIR